ncbi:MAG TPA: hypothetical protein DIV57_02630 [Stenotrophomonas sp.]|nr:hypothetical protein [Stenotrophomonas sp.]
MFSHTTTQAARRIQDLQNLLVFLRIDPDIRHDGHQMLEAKGFENTLDVRSAQFADEIGVIK